MTWPVSATLLVLCLAGGNAFPGMRPGLVRQADMDGGGGADINLVVRKVSFAPVRAHVGDAIRIEVILEDMGEGYITIPARITANGKEVAHKLFTFGGMKGDRIYRETFLWDTLRAAPGEYKIRADFFVWEDSSPFDNEMTVGKPLLLLPKGAPFPDGLPPGGTASETDPRFHASDVPGRNPE